MSIRITAVACIVSVAALAQPAGRRARQPSAADASTLLTLMQIYFSEPIQKARRFWATELGEEMTLAEFEARFPRGSEGRGHFNTLASFWETVGVAHAEGAGERGSRLRHLS